MSKTPGSEKRQLSVIIQSRVSLAEKATVKANADAAKVSVSELIRVAILKYRPPRSKADDEFAKSVLTQLQNIRGELGKSGSNLNQIAYHLNAGRPGDVMEGSLQAAIHEHEQALRTLEELRLACMQSLGYERNRKPPQK